MRVFLPQWLQRVAQRFTKVREVEAPRLPNGYIGFARWFSIDIAVRNPAAPHVWKHEWVHIYQAWQLLFVGHWLMKKLSRDYRINCEAAAYAVSVHHGETIDNAAWALSTSYDWELTSTDAALRIRKYLVKGKWILNLTRV